MRASENANEFRDEVLYCMNEEEVEKVGASWYY